jgi:hypothetical protein
MPTASWNSAALLAVLLVAGPAFAQTGKGIALEHGRRGTSVTLPVTGGTRARLPLDVDAVSVVGRASSVREVARTEAFLVIVDTHPSRRQGMRRCQAGEERFLRLIALKPSPREWQRIKLASCVDTIEPAEPDVTWDRAGGVLSVRWLSGPVDGAARAIRFDLAP